MEAKREPASPPYRLTNYQTPKLSFGSWAFAFGPYEQDPWSISKICQYLARSGYDGIEINGFRPHPHDLDFDSTGACRVLSDLIAEYGLSVSAYAPDLTDVPPSRVDNYRYLRRIDSARAFCERMEIALLRIDTVVPPRPVVTSIEHPDFQQLATVWRHAAQRCKRSGVTLVWEFEPGFWLNRPHEVLGLLEEIAHPNFRVLFDTSHAYTGAVHCARQGREPEPLAGGLEAYAALLAPWLGHMHLIDSDGSLHDDETSAHIPFGSGVIDFSAVLASLGEPAKRLPWWTVDLCYSDRTEAEGIAAASFVREAIGMGWHPDGRIGADDGHASVGVRRDA